MTACTKAPAGWTCSREAGHEGPCAAVHESMQPSAYLLSVMLSIDEWRMIVDALRGHAHTALGHDEVESVKDMPQMQLAERLRVGMAKVR